MPEINLLQEHKKSFGGLPKPTLTLPARSGKGFLVFLIFLFILEAAAYGGLFYLRKKADADTSSAEGQIASIQNAINQRGDELQLAVSAQARLRSLQSLIDNHIKWSIVWDELAKQTLTVGYFTSIEAATESGNFVVSGTVATYSDLGKMILGLEQSEKFEHIILESAEKDDTGVGFDLTVIMASEALMDKQE